MSGTQPSHSTLVLAKKTLMMSEKTGDKRFQKMPLGLMALTGIATLLHAAHEISRDIKPKREPAREEQTSPLPTPAHVGEHGGGHEHGESTRRSWVEASRVQKPKPVERHSPPSTLSGRNSEGLSAVGLVAVRAEAICLLGVNETLTGPI